MTSIKKMNFQINLQFIKAVFVFIFDKQGEPADKELMSRPKKYSRMNKTKFAYIWEVQWKALLYTFA